MKTIIRDIREELKMTIEQFGSLTGVSISTVYNLESGSLQTINANVLQALDRLGYDIEFVKKQYQEDRAAKT